MIILFQSIEFFKIVFNLSVQSVEQEGHYVIFICLHFIDELNQVMEGPCHLLYLLIKSTRLWNCHMSVFSSVLLISWTGLWQGLTSNLYVSVSFLSLNGLWKGLKPSLFVSVLLMRSSRLWKALMPPFLKFIFIYFNLVDTI